MANKEQGKNKEKKKKKQEKPKPPKKQYSVPVVRIAQSVLSTSLKFVFLIWGMCHKYRLKKYLMEKGDCHA